jgi:hypothetical protein
MNSDLYAYSYMYKYGTPLIEIYEDDIIARTFSVIFYWLSELSRIKCMYTLRAIEIFKYH